MRRLWAYILTIFTAIVLVGVSFANIFIRMDSNIEYQSGREMVYRVSMKEGDYEGDQDTIDNIADVMKQRLKTFGVDTYEIKTVGYDTVKVTLSETNSEHYDMISNFVTFNGELALTTAGLEDVPVAVAKSDSFLSGKKAYLTSTNSIPQIALPVNNQNEEFLAVVAAAEEELSKMDTSGDEDSGETSTAYMYFWYDYIDDVDSYEASQSDESMAKKILIPFDISGYTKDEETGLYPDKLITTVSVDTDGDGTASVTELQNAYYRANYYVNLVNALKTEYKKGDFNFDDYKVTYIYYNDATPSVESLIYFGEQHEYLGLSATMISVIIAFVLVSAVLVAFYRLSALSAIATTSVSVFGAMAFMILFQVTMNMASIIGLATVALVSLASSIIYFEKLKIEAYKGRTLKKANSEASKKSTLPIVDVNVVSIVIGAMIFLIGGSVMKGLSAALVLGGILSLVLNTLGLKGLMWLATNTTKLAGKYDVFNIDSTKVPNIANEEKQTYFGRFAGKDLTKHRKPFFIAMMALLVTSLAGIITFGAINNGDIFSRGQASRYVENTEVYFEAINNQYVFSDATVKNILDDVLIYEEGVAADQLESLKDHIKGEIVIPTTMTEKIAEDGVLVEYTHYYYVAVLDAKYDASLKVINRNEVNAVAADVNTVLENIIVNNYGAMNASASLKQIKNVSNDYPGFAQITLATFVGIAILTAYFVLRYRPSRGLIYLLATSFIGAIAMGLFVLTRVVVSSIVLAALPAVIIAASAFAIYFMNREREMVLDDKTRDTSLAHREEIMVAATSSAMDTNLMLVAIGSLLSIGLFGFSPEAIYPSYIFLFLGLVLAFVFISVLYGPASQLLGKLFSKIKFEPKPRKNKKSNKPKKKSAEPEEAIFIGIND